MNKKGLIVVFSIVFLIIAGISVFFLSDSFANNPTLGIDGADNTSPSGDSNTVTITFPEGFAAVEIAEKLEENDVCSAEAFLEVVKNPSDEILTTLGITNKDERLFTLEGYIFPDTYEFYKGENPVSVLGRFINNFNSKITDTDRSRAAELGYTIDEIITIASVIQEEAGRADQDSKVSSVLHNRLNTNTPLQCDVTYQYLYNVCKPYLPNGVTDEIANNYDSYKCPALPKGPISNPGYAAIQAALYPEQTDYFYFVTDADMNYYYSKTWEEHCSNCHIAGIEGY